ncbi:diguanylate cyclase domain-containing protein [Rhodocyclaceae bacterium SMB388]
MDAILKPALRWRGEAWIRRRDGDAFPALVAVRAIRDSDGATLSHVVTITDISVSKEVEERLRQLTLNDQLTGLVDRPMLADRLDESIANCRDSGTRLGVLFLNLDRFKLINDSLGHAAGDEAQGFLFSPAIPVDALRALAVRRSMNLLDPAL